MKKKLIIVAVGALVICGLLLSSGALAGNNLKGNGFPSGQHYNLNIIGVNGKTQVGDSMGHTIFVDLKGRTSIIMTQGDEFKVVDRNGLDDKKARFTIAPGVYDVYARALGSPKDKPWVNISAYKFAFIDEDDETKWIYLDSVELNREKGKKPQAENINKLFYVGNNWIFYTDLEGYLWDYNNKGLKLCQVRFYENTTYGGIEPTP